MLSPPRLVKMLLWALRPERLMYKLSRPSETGSWRGEEAKKKGTKKPQIKKKNSIGRTAAIGVARYQYFKSVRGSSKDTLLDPPEPSASETSGVWHSKSRRWSTAKLRPQKQVPSKAGALQTQASWSSQNASSRDSSPPNLQPHYWSPPNHVAGFLPT